MKPAVSVVLPFRDAAPTLPDAIESIRTQTLAELECLLVDDGSMDGSSAIARRVAAEDPRFRLLQAGSGLVGALNLGIEAARADWIARMDADDFSHPRRLERQLAAARATPDVAVVGSLVRCFPAAALRDGMRRYEAWLNSLTTPEQIRNALFVESPLAHPSVLISRAALQAAGGYHDTGGPEDYDLWLRLLLGPHRACKVAEVLLDWRDSPGRLTRTHPCYRAERIFETKLRYVDRVIPSGSPLQIWGAGPIGRGWGRELLRRGYRLRRYIDIDPRKIGRKRRGVPVEAPAALARDDGYVLVAVGSPGARDLIEPQLQGRGFEPWRDYLCVA